MRNETNQMWRDYKKEVQGIKKGNIGNAKREYPQLNLKYASMRNGFYIDQRNENHYQLKHGNGKEILNYYPSTRRAYGQNGVDDSLVDTKSLTTVCKWFYDYLNGSLKFN